MPTRRSQSRGSRASIETFLAVLIPLTFVGLAIADFLKDGQIDKYLIGALMIFGLGALGYRVDTLIEKYLDMKTGGGPPHDEPPAEK